MPPQQSASMAQEAPCSAPPPLAGQPASTQGQNEHSWLPGSSRSAPRAQAYHAPDIHKHRLRGCKAVPCTHSPCKPAPAASSAAQAQQAQQAQHLGAARHSAPS